MNIPLRVIQIESTNIFLTRPVVKRLNRQKDTRIYHRSGEAVIQREASGLTAMIGFDRAHSDVRRERPLPTAGPPTG
jgi:hypothetical protein